MPRNPVVDLTRRTLACLSGGEPECGDDIGVEPAEVFTDHRRFRADHVLMRRVPHVVGWVGEVQEPGDYTTKDVAGVSVLLVRDRVGVLRAFLNACAHRGAQVAAGAGRSARFTCPYHAWSYGPDGRLAGVPGRQHFDGLDLDDLGLRPLPVSERGGLVAVGLDPSVDPDPLLDDVEDELVGSPYSTCALIESRTFTVAANWKLAIDVNFEGYHFSALHRASLFELATGHAPFDTFGRHCRWAFPFRGIEALADVPDDQLDGAYMGTVVYGLFPSCVLVEAAGSSQMIRAYPGRTPGEAVVTVASASHTPFTEAERAGKLDGYEIAYDLLRGEDFPAAESCQRGFEGGVEQMLVGRNEPLLRHLHRVWRSATDDIDPPDHVPTPMPVCPPARPGVVRRWADD